MAIFSGAFWMACEHGSMWQSKSISKCWNCNKRALETPLSNIQRGQIDSNDPNVPNHRAIYKWLYVCCMKIAGVLFIYISFIFLWFFSLIKRIQNRHLFKRRKYTYRSKYMNKCINDIHKNRIHLFIHWKRAFVLESSFLFSTIEKFHASLMRYFKTNMYRVYLVALFFCSLLFYGNSIEINHWNCAHYGLLCTATA